LREALHTLSAEGLVTFDANGTAYVVPPSAEALREIYSIREVLECLAGRAAVDHITDDQITQAEAILDAMEGVADPLEWASLNASFHRVIYDAAGKPQLFELIEILRNRAKLYVALLAADIKNATHAAAEHRAMLDALRHRDADGMESLIRQHLTTTTLKVGANLEDASAKEPAASSLKRLEGAG
jgi:DNA-binding GntR family transcriptional regulator